MTLQFLAVLVLGLVCGSELNVAAFAHPTLDRQPLKVHILVRSSFAALFGRVMPFWMAGSTLPNLILLFTIGHLDKSTWHLAEIGLIIQVLAVLFSLVGPVPSITGLPSGRRSPFLTIGERSSIAGILTIG